MTNLTADNLRAALALLRWRVEDAAEKANVGKFTVARLLRGENVRQETRDKISAAIEAAGVELFNGDRPGARVR